MAGPFAGQRLAGNTTGSHGPKLLGIYERELHSIVEHVVKRAYRIIVDIGCGEGYYAVGFALRMPEAMIYAYDSSPEARDACQATAALNGVADRVVVGGLCDHEAFRRLAAGAFIWLDCEGCERTLMDPVAVPELATADMLIETHDFLVPGTTEALLKAFSKTHDAEVIRVQPRRPEEAAPLRLGADDAARAVDESRQPDQTWLALRSRT